MIKKEWSKDKVIFRGVLRVFAYFPSPIVNFSLDTFFGWWRKSWSARAENGRELIEIRKQLVEFLSKLLR